MATKKKKIRKAKNPAIKEINLYAAGVDIGATSNFVAVDPSLDPEYVREFETYTDSMQELVQWLLSLGIKTVALESTGIYWVHLFVLLEKEGIEACLVNPRDVKNAPGRKSDVCDCQWLQTLHSMNLLERSFVPPPEICTLRAYVRQRATIVRYAASHIQHMQKALRQMNVMLDIVVSDITGKTGMSIINAILEGERDPFKLAQLRDKRCKKSVKEIARGLNGIYRDEYIHQLRLSLESYTFYQGQIAELDDLINNQIAALTKLKNNDNDKDQAQETSPQNFQELPRRRDEHLSELLDGVDLTKIEGIDSAWISRVKPMNRHNVGGEETLQLRPSQPNWPQAMCLRSVKTQSKR